jgi:hypothetical protein
MITAPSAVTYVTATAGVSSVTATWPAVTDGGSPVLDYIAVLVRSGVTVSTRTGITALTTAFTGLLN